MNSLVVSMMDQLDSNSPPSLHASEKALQGYSYMHHILLFLASKHPRMVTVANARVNKFLKAKDGTSKTFTPNLGEFLPLLRLAQNGWGECKWAYVREGFARNTRWVLKHVAKLDRERRSSPASTKLRTALLLSTL